MNKELMRRVRDQILQDPGGFDMNAYVYRVDLDNPYYRNIQVPPQCDTVCCIAGRTVALKGGKRPGTDIFLLMKRIGRRLGIERPDYDEVAARLLGISLETASVFFHEEEWPEPFRSRYREAEHDVYTSHSKEPYERRARVAAEFIDYLMEHDGVLPTHVDTCE